MTLEYVREEFEAIDKDNYGYVNRAALEKYARSTNQEPDFASVRF